MSASSLLQRRNILQTIFALLLCFLTAVSVSGQTQTNGEAEVGIEEIYVARSDGNGKPGEKSETFFTNDIPIYCVIQLNSSVPATVKMNFIAVKANNLKPETKIVTVSYKTNGNQNRVYFNASPEGKWSAGTYRVDISVNGKSPAGHIFEIKSSPGETQNQNKPVPTRRNKPRRKN
jgi:hypothetical protein